MKSYEVRLVRKIEQEERATIVVEAETDDGAAAMALSVARRNELNWSSDLMHPEVSGDVKVETIEAIIDHEEDLDT